MNIHWTFVMIWPFIVKGKISPVTCQHQTTAAKCKILIISIYLFYLFFNLFIYFGYSIIYLLLCDSAPADDLEHIAVTSLF